MSTTLETQPQNDMHTLDAALHKLVETGELSDAQALRVHDTYAVESATPAGTAPAAAAPRPSSWTRRLVEVGAYLGAALVAAGGAIIVGQQWDELGRGGQLVLLAALTAVFGAAGAAAAWVDHRREEPEADRAVLRRLASTLLTLAAAATAGFVAIAYLPAAGAGDPTDARLGWMFLTIAAATGSVLVVTRLVAPSALAEIGLYGAVLAAPTGLLFFVNLPESSDLPALVAVLFAVVGVAYAAVASTTRALTAPTLGTVLGLATALIAAIGDSPTSRVLLAVLAVGCFAAYLARPRWPFVAAAMLAAVILTFVVVGDAFNPAVAMLVAGVALLALAAGTLLLQRRRSVRQGEPRTS
jgi:hypothetical protein